jgi:hypothetical protein
MSRDHPGSANDSGIADCYEIRVRGQLTAAVAAAFEGLHAQLEPAENMPYGRFRDNELFGVLDRLQPLRAGWSRFTGRRSARLASDLMQTVLGDRTARRSPIGSERV